MSQALPSELYVVVISRNADNLLLQVDYEQDKYVALAWRNANSAMAWVKDGGIVTQANEQPGGDAYKMSFRLPDGSRLPIGEIQYFKFPTSELRQMNVKVVCLDPTPASVKGTLVRL